MSDFATAFDSTMIFEGVYSKNPNDPGGETVFGISRVHHPDWLGWVLVDSLKKEKGEFNDSMDLIEIKEYRDYFYKSEFWDKIKGDEIQDQKLAEILFDTSVHNGIGFAVKSLQESLNLLLGCSLIIDGGFGSKTLEKMKEIKPDSLNLETLKKMLMVFRGYLFIELARDNEFHRGNLRGYFKRL